MFNTLRHEGSGSGEYVVQPASAPFNKPRQKKVVRLACVRCKSKKMKCTGEKGGCQRCIEKGAQCSYSMGRRASRSTSFTKTGPRDEERPETPTMLTPASRQMADLDTNRDLLGSDMSGTITPFELLDTDPDFMNTFDLGALLNDTSNLDPMLPSQGVSSDSGADSSHNLDRMRSVTHSPNIGRCDIGITAISEESRCSCAGLVRVYEKVEVYLVWAARDRSGGMSLRTDEMLCCQKDVLSSCESVLDCDVCSPQPERAILMISIFNKLLASIVEMSSMSPAKTTDDGGPRRFSGNIFNGQKRPTSAADGGFMVSNHFMSNKGQNTEAGSSESRSFTFDTSDWNVDNEDKMHMFQCLLNIRYMRLKDLIDRLGVVVMKNHWLIHRSMLRDLLERFTECNPI